MDDVVTHRRSLRWLGRLAGLAALVALVWAVCVWVGADVPSAFGTTVIEVPSWEPGAGRGSFVHLCGSTRPAGVQIGDTVIGVVIGDPPSASMSGIPGAPQHGVVEIEHRSFVATSSTFVADDGTRTEMAEVPHFHPVAYDCA